MGHFPQTLSRFYDLECKDYVKAEKYAKQAKEIAPHSSFFADTLGQVYKHNLKDQWKMLECNCETLAEILALAAKAFQAFKHAEALAEDEHEMRHSTIFNPQWESWTLGSCKHTFFLEAQTNGSD